MSGSRTTYASAGVDSRHVRQAHQVLARRLESTFKTRHGKIGWPLYPIGHYAGLVDLGGGRVLSLHTDSVGTKVMVAKMMGRYDTIGIDCVAMCANDLICTGAEPVSFLDYIAMSKPDRAVVEEVAVGLSKGAKEAGMAIVGGETAIVPELLSDAGFDLTGFAAGVCKKSELILGDRVVAGDCLVGVASSGIHSNGLSLARKVLFKRYGLKDSPRDLGRSVGEELLEPTRIYVKPVREMTVRGGIHGIAHITGGGAFLKLERVLKEGRLGADLDGLPEPPGIFKLIQRTGRVSDREMYRTFNMGVGLVVACAQSEAERVVRVFKKYHMDAVRIGTVEKKPGVRINGRMLD